MSTHTGDPNVFKGGCTQDCPDTCAMVYTVDSGSWYRCTVRPNIRSRAARLCVKLKDFAKHHYNPNRLLYPQRRVGSKGSGQYDPLAFKKRMEGLAWSFASPDAVFPSGNVHVDERVGAPLGELGRPPGGLAP